MSTIVNYLLFPGLVFSLAAGGIGWWLERKLSARFQFRVGPPWYQNFIDILKLFYKETLIPASANRFLFVASPVINFASVAVLALIINKIYFSGAGFLGDIIVILYLLIIPSIFVVIGAFASNNPLATTGAAREIKLMLSYEFIFIVSIITVIIKTGGIFSLEGIIAYQGGAGANIKSISGLIAFVLSFCYMQAKLGIVPFDVGEAEQEIMGGAFIEYSGPLLGFFKLSKAMLFFTLPLLLVALFLGNCSWHLVYVYIIIILLISVVKNTNPRLRIKDILQFFWFLLFPLGCIGIILALLGY